jgi:MFS-type transporter involved in bile tolerance (Atg22 family)
MRRPNESWPRCRIDPAIAAVPAVAFVLALTFLRNGPGAIQASFYVVYLGEMGLTGTIIGALVSLSELFAAIGALVAAPIARLVKLHWAVLGFVASAILFIVITPAIAPYLVLLLLAAAARGMSQGINQPMMFAILARSVGPEVQGATVGLRNTVNRLSSIVLPAIMGLAATVWGIAASFYVVGIVLLAGCFALGIVIFVRDATTPAPP